MPVDASFAKISSRASPRPRGGEYFKKTRLLSSKRGLKIICATVVLEFSFLWGVVIVVCRDVDQGNRQGNADWNKQQLAISRALDMAHLDEEQLRQAELERHLSVLAHQQAVARMKKDEEKRERYGGISADFFNNFGKSAR